MEEQAIEEEIPPWDWRRTMILETALFAEREKNVELSGKLAAAESLIEELQTEQGRIKMRVDKIEMDIAPKPMLPMVVK